MYIVLSAKNIEIRANTSSLVEVTLDQVDEYGFYDLVDMERLIYCKGVSFVLDALDVETVKREFDLKDNDE